MKQTKRALMGLFFLLYWYPQLRSEYLTPELAVQYPNLENAPCHQHQHQIVMTLTQEFSTQDSASQRPNEMDDTPKTSWGVTLATDPTLLSFGGPSK